MRASYSTIHYMLTKTWYGDGSEVVQTRCAAYRSVDVDGGGVGNARDQVYPHGLAWRTNEEMNEVRGCTDAVRCLSWC